MRTDIPSEPYTLEHVLLIHHETSLLLHHRAGPRPCLRELHAVAGMLSAIRDIICDSFILTTPPPLTAHSLVVGDITLWIEPGPLAVLAAVARGTPPASLRTDLQHAIASIHEEAAPLLRAFTTTGDPAPLRVIHHHVDALFVRPL